MSEHELWNELGNLYFNTGAYTEAINAYRKAIEMDPDFGWPYSNLALTYAHQGKYAEAISLYQRSIELLTDRREKAVSWNRLGNIYRLLKEYDSAMAAFQRADELDSESAAFSDLDEMQAASATEAVFVDSEAVTEGIPIATVQNSRALDSQPALFGDDLLPEVEPDASVEPLSSTEAWVTVDPGSSGGEDDLEAFLMNREAPETSTLSEAAETAALPDAQLDQEWEKEREPLPDEDPEMDFAVSTPAGSVEMPPADMLQPVMQEPFPLESPTPASPADTSVGQAGYSISAAGAQPLGVPTELALEESASSLFLSPDSAPQDPISEESDAGLEMAADERSQGRVGGDPADETEADLEDLAAQIAKFKRVIEVNPRNAFAWDTLGNLYKSTERYADAIAAYEQAISIDPGKAFYFHHLGLVYAAQKRYDDAVSVFHRVLELDPNYSLAHATLAGYYRKLGRENEANRHIFIAEATIRDENEYNRACFESIRGNVDQAIDLLRVALKNNQTTLDWVCRDPDLDFIRDDPRFRALLDAV